MALTFHLPESAIDFAMKSLKADRFVHPDAKFCPDAPGGLRREVTYRDADFLERVACEDVEEAVVDAALGFLKSKDLVASESTYDKEAFLAFRKEIKVNFKGSWTTITPPMERLLYMLTSVRRPKRLIELGSFWGNTLAWYAGPCIGSKKVYDAEKIYGVEVDIEMHDLARENYSRIANCEALDLIGEDALTALERLEGPFDSLYLESKSDEVEGLYLILVKKIYDKLPKGAWVLAHDPTRWKFIKDMEGYLAWVRDKVNFRESICFDIDAFGLELSIK